MADEAFDRIDRRPPGDPLGHSGLADLVRREQSDIEIGRNDRMVKGGFAGLHRILVVAEFRETVVEEVAQRLEGAGARDGPAERLEIAEMTGEVPIDQLYHLAGGRIRREAQARRGPFASGQRLPVLGIEVPVAAGGLARPPSTGPCACASRGRNAPSGRASGPEPRRRMPRVNKESGRRAG